MSTLPKFVVHPIAPDCSHYDPPPPREPHHSPFKTGKKCNARATVRMFAPDGVRVPGGWFCQHHGELIVSEYAIKLGEVWHLVPIVDKDPTIPTCPGCKLPAHASDSDDDNYHEGCR